MRIPAIVLTVLSTLTGCGLTPERVAGWSDFDLCYESFFPLSASSLDPNRAGSVKQEIVRRKLNCTNYEQAVKSRHQQYQREMTEGMDYVIGTFGRKK